VQGIAARVITAATIAVLGVLLAPKLLGVMGASPTSSRWADYTRVMLGGNVVILLLFLINAISAERAMRRLRCACSGSRTGINIILGPLLIFGVGPFPRLGVTGAAIATKLAAAPACCISSIGCGGAMVASSFTASRSSSSRR